MIPFGVLADDLTGCCDTGVQFSQRGARVLVLTDLTAVPPSTDWDVVVLNSESRHRPPGEAAQQAASGATTLNAAGWPVRYKKIDSTLRGNWVAESRALLESGGALLVAPSFPPAGRTVERGILWVNGRPVHETEFGRDRHNPVTESHLPTVLEALAVPAGQVTLRDLLGTPEHIADKLSQLAKEGVRVVAADSVDGHHLATLAEAILGATARGPVDWIGVGSAGLASALAQQLWPEPDSPAVPPGFPGEGPVLVVAGSRTQVTRAQVDVLRAEPDTFELTVDPTLLDRHDWPAMAQIWTSERSAALIDVARAGAQVLLVTIAQPEDDGGESGEQFKMRSQRLNGALGQLVSACAVAMALGGLVLTGGDIARAVLTALDAQALQLGPEVLPGIPLGWPTVGNAKGLPVITKAGGFGAPQALSDAARFLRR